MATTLDQLLETIAPNRTLDEVAARADAAMASFDFGAAVTATWEEFGSCLGGFFRHVENSVLRLPADLGLDPEFDWGRCRHHLKDACGPKGELAAFDMARTGVEGGLRAVLAAVAKRMIQRYAQTEIATCVGKYWGNLTLDEKLADPKEYLAKYGHLLPSDFTDGSGARFVASFPKVLERHPQLIHDLRLTGR